MNEAQNSLTLGRLSEAQFDEAAVLIHNSLASWYGRHLNQPDRFGGAWEPFRIFPEVYEALDPGCAVTARDPVTQKLLGICFYHPRPSHISVGIVVTHPATGGRGVARVMLEEVLAFADASNLPVRLVSSLMSLDSFSLYTRLGFVPGTVFQDLQFPPGKLPPQGEVPGTIRPMLEADVPAMVELEERLTGLRRKQDFAFFVRNDRQLWNTLVLIGPDGILRGFLGSIAHGGTQMLGPGLMQTEEDALALICAQLHHHAPGNPVILVPARAAGLVASLYRAGARNVELHVAQVRGTGREPDGIVIPTFLPESG
ncbi:MAG: GNAT family N-acetyltransferase [Verrucomicrobiota bacterium]